MSSSIEWTDETWNPVVGCSPVSEGCRNCYAAKEAIRLGSNPNAKIRAAYEGTSEMRGAGSARRAVFTGRINLLPHRLEEPLHWRKPRRVFVNSMSDLFHEDVPFDYIDRVFAVMALCPQHTFQVLTKRPERMAEYLNSPGVAGAIAAETGSGPGGDGLWPFIRPDDLAARMPLPNVWLGTSVEDQQRADERIPHLLRTPAAVRFLSCEPLLGPLDIRPFLGSLPGVLCCPQCGFRTNRFSRCPNDDRELTRDIGIDWCIVGGESGPGARPFALQWAESLIKQCRSGGVACFVKQIGARPYDHDTPEGGPLYGIRDSKGGNIEEWPAHLRVREFPEVLTGSANREVR